MIGRLVGVIVGEDPDGTLVVDVQGVGYEVCSPLGARARLAAGAHGEVVLWVHTHVREDAFDLFGFVSEIDRRVFRLLVSVPNVGPKTALAVLGSLPVDELATAVQRGDLARLGKVPGIGKKTAERLVLELREKLPKLAAIPSLATARPNSSLAERLRVALTHMGYRPAEADSAVERLGERVNEGPIESLLKEALAILAQRS